MPIKVIHGDSSARISAAWGTPTVIADWGRNWIIPAWA